MLAAAVFFAGHLAASACFASMTLTASRKPKPAHSCCQKRAPAQAPVPQSCCCVDGPTLALVDDQAGGIDAPPAFAHEVPITAPETTALLRSARGREPPDRASDVPLHILHRMLLV